MMNFIDAAESGMKKWITFSGRASRSEYWWFILLYYILVVIINVAQAQIGKAIPGLHGNLPLLLLSMVGSLTTIFCSGWLLCAATSLLVRRLHDVDRSGWWYWIGLTIIGALFPLFYWTCIKGSTGPNRFGADPLQGNEGNMIT